MKLLICGSRGFEVKHEDISNVLAKFDWTTLEIIEGCCKNSADEVAENWASENKIEVYHYPAKAGSHLKRNIQMVDRCDAVLAFWDGYSYGTAHTIAQAILKGKKVIIKERGRVR